MAVMCNRGSEATDAAEDGPKITEGIGEDKMAESKMATVREEE